MGSIFLMTEIKERYDEIHSRMTDNRCINGTRFAIEPTKEKADCRVDN